MTLNVSCPTCKSTFKADPQHIGKVGRCPKCGTNIKIGAVAGLVAPVEAPPVQPPPGPTPAFHGTVNPVDSERFSFSSVLKSVPRYPRTGIVVIAVTSILAGYFLGREHLKYELRTATSKIEPLIRPDAPASERLAAKMLDNMLRERTPEEQAEEKKKLEEWKKENEQDAKRSKARNVTSARVDNFSKRHAELIKLRSEGKITKQRRAEADDFFKRYEKLSGDYREDKLTTNEWQKRIAEFKAEFDAWDANEPPTMRAEAEAERSKLAALKAKRDELSKRIKPFDGFKQLELIEKGKLTAKDIERQQAEAEALQSEVEKLNAEIEALEPEGAVRFFGL